MATRGPTSSQWHWELPFTVFWVYCWHLTWRGITFLRSGPSSGRLASGWLVRCQCTCTLTRPGHTPTLLSQWRYLSGIGTELGAAELLASGLCWHWSRV